MLSSMACLAWVAVRAGRKPSRINYPCQRAALTHSAWLLPAAGLLAARAVRSRVARRALSLALVSLVVAGMALGVGGDGPAGAVGRPVPDLAAARANAATLEPAVWRGAAADGAHDVFVVDHVPPANPASASHDGVNALLRLLAEGGVHLYGSDIDNYLAAPDGLISPNDVVLVKVNAAWDQRGMTNTDVVRGIIAAVLSHPDGFTGEVVVVENCEGGVDYLQQYNNAENTAQSFQAVVDSFGDPARVSASSWWSFTDAAVNDFDTGDGRTGYVWLGDNMSYPKWTTPRGTLISLRNGVWTGSGYDRSRVKMINVPVLKSHSTAGVTGCMKNFMGVPSIHWTTDQHSDLLYRGFMGRLMNNLIFPTLNILDAVWVSPSHPRGPEGPYSLAVRTDILLAGTDPVAVDYYAAKHVLFPVSGYGRHDPDTPYGENTSPYHDGSSNTGYPYNAFRIMMDITAAELVRGGHDVSGDPARIAVHRRDLREGLGWTGGHCVVGTGEPATAWYFAEGTTRQGFEEWVCLENPGSEAAQVQLAFQDSSGEVIPIALDVPAGSRRTVHANRVVGPGKDVSCAVTSDRPIVAERATYFDYAGAWTGGHTVVGARAASQTWYFAEGYTGPGFDQYVCVLNPGESPAGLTFRFQTSEAGEVVKPGLSVGPHTRATFKVNDLLGAGYQNSLCLESDGPVVAERPVYFDYAGSGGFQWNGGHCVMGAAALSREYLFAEGTTREGFEEWLTVQNPGASTIRVNAEYLPGEGQGPAVSKAYDIAAGRRFTVHVADEVGADRDVSVRLNSASPFLAERPMYFRYRGYGADYTGGHCVVGAPGGLPECHFAEGYTGGTFQEWLCLANPGATDATVQVDYLTQEAGSLPARYVTVPAASRVNVRVNDSAGPGYQVSCRLKVLSGPDVMVERPMYFDYR
ncbi:MAG: DUF362 domain-containing protein [Actinobacteria bacterium]|nr:DUF362 domain-containing protein [Actinomycetota bacterium]